MATRNFRIDPSYFFVFYFAVHTSIEPPLVETFSELHGFSVTFNLIHYDIHRCAIFDFPIRISISRFPSTETTDGPFRNSYDACIYFSPGIPSGNGTTVGCHEE
jgi:hypothetical protein